MRATFKLMAFGCLCLTAGAVASSFASSSSAAASSQRPAAAAPAPAAAQATAAIVTAAEAVLASLDDAGRAAAQFPFDDDGQRRRWSNFPSPMFERKGIKLAGLTPPQRAAVTALLQTALSANGYRKVTEIMRGDEMLRLNGDGRGPRGGGPPAGPPADGPPPGGRGRGGRGGLVFGQDEYYLAFVGVPSATAPWMLQFGGHHLAINLTMRGGESSMTPSLPAAQPAVYTFEGREIRPLGQEHDKAFALMGTLDDRQRQQAIIGAQVADLVLGPTQDGRTIQPEGLKASAMTAAQQEALLAIVREWAGIPNDAFAAPRMAEIRAGLADTWFAWSGPTTPGGAAYFRIQGPALVIEYAPQGSVDHIHTIYRDPTNDYGARFAKP